MRGLLGNFTRKLHAPQGTISPFPADHQERGPTKVRMGSCTVQPGRCREGGSLHSLAV